MIWLKNCSLGIKQQSLTHSYTSVPLHWVLILFQTSTTSLETINLGHNNITNEGIHFLKEGLLQNKSLLRIGLQGTKVTCEGKSSVHSLDTVIQYNLSNPTHEGTREICRIVQDVGKLKSFFVNRNTVEPI